MRLTFYLSQIDCILENTNPHIQDEYKIKIKLFIILLDQIWVSIKLASVFQSPGPGKNARNRIGAGWSSLTINEHTKKISMF